MFKNLSCKKYWTNFGNLGSAVGAANMPTPKEAASTVVALMDKVRSLEKDVEEANARLSACIGEVEKIGLDFAVRFDNLRHEVRGIR